LLRKENGLILAASIISFRCSVNPAPTPIFWNGTSPAIATCSLTSNCASEVGKSCPYFIGRAGAGEGFAHSLEQQGIG
jgi:hypothetical protein